MNRKLTLLLTLLCLAGCTKSTSSTSPEAQPDPRLEQRIAAARQTALQNALCTAVAPFYWEIGNSSATQVSGSTGDGSVTATTPLQIASASKWLFSAYVVEKLGGSLSSSIIKGLNLTSGYSGFTSCVGRLTVGSCYTNVTTYDSLHDGKFYYSGGHMQKIAAVELDIGTLNSSGLSNELLSYLGSDIALIFSIPQPAGGVQMTPSSYSAFLRKVLNGQLLIKNFLGTHSVCTNVGSCSSSAFTPTPGSESWSYSLGHWMESDPIVGDNAYSSPGHYGFYPWINSTKSYYGILARYENSSSASFESVYCGRLIRKAFETGAPQ